MTVESPRRCASATPSRAMLYRIARAALENRQIDLLAKRLQLFDGGGAVDVCGDQQAAPPLFLQAQCQLPGLRRLARALQTDQHDDRRRRVGELQTRLAPPPSSATSSS